MNANRKIITLFSSESTVQYIKDVFSVLALPRGSLYQFRYDSRYIESNLLDIFSSNQNVNNLKALIVFRSASDAQKENCFLVPVRWASIVAISSISNGYTIDFSLEGYPNFSQDFKDSCSSFSGINTRAQSFFYGGSGEKNTFAVWDGPLPCVQLDFDKDNQSRDSELWFQIVSSIAKVSQYQGYLFFKCSKLYSERYDTNSISSVPCEIRSKHSVLTEGQCAYAEIEFYSTEYKKEINREIEIFIDENVMRKSKGLHCIIESRYGTLKVGFQPKKVANNTVSEIVLCSKSSNKQELSTDITYPIIVVKNRTYKAVKAIIMAIGALLVAIPGILDNTVSVWTNIILAGIGVTVLGVNTYWESKE